MGEEKRRDVPSVLTKDHDDDNKFLKVTPNLFTPERLHMFDSLDLYTSLIKCSKNIEQGERLHNISWRIINKSLLKDQDINKSKKREGVKNLYYVLNPVANKQPLSQQQRPPEKAASKQTHGKEQPQHQHRQKTQSHTNLHVAHSPRYGNRSNMPQSKIKPLEPFRSDSSNTSLFGGNKQNKSTSALSQNHGDAHSSHHHYMNKKEDPQTIVKGFDPNTIIKANKPATATSSSRLKSGLDEGKQQKKNTFYIGASPSPEPGTTNNSQKTLTSRQESLFGKPRIVDVAAGNGGLSTSHKSNLFFSSEDEDDEDDTDWDDDSLLYDEEDEENLDDEEEDQYYRKQWDKLLFAKNHNHQTASGASSGNVTPNSQSSHDPIKRSLLSGLFLNEQINNCNSSVQHHTPSSDKAETRRESPLSLKPINSSHSTSSTGVSHSNPKNINAQKATLETSNVTAVGSVTPPQRANNGGLASALYKGATRSNRGSFSSIVSESTRQRYTGESNAPPAAQTILPTALSTHMFLPNNIHQQRLAAIAASEGSAIAMSRNSTPPSSIREFKKKQARRESMDIPSKNKNKTNLKTRVEISNEEKFSRVYSRRNL